MRLPAGAEWIIILLIVLLLFGASRLPGLAKSVGRSMRIFRSEVKDISKDDPDGADSGERDTTTTGASPASSDAGAATGRTPTHTDPATPGTTTSDDDSGRTHP